MDSTHPDVTLGVTVLFTILLVAMIACLALEEKLHAKKSLIVSAFAVISLALGTALHLIPFGDVVLPGGHAIQIPVYIPSVDWNVIAIIVGSSVFVDVTSRSGLFTWIAVRLTKMSKGDPLRLLWYYGWMTVLFSAVLNNVTAMIIVGSLTGVSLKKLNLTDKLMGFLLIEGLLTNVGGLLTLISSVPNIIVGNAAEISFFTFFVVSSPYVLVATVVTLLLGARLYQIQSLESESQIQKSTRLVNSFDENDGIQSRGFFYLSTVVLCAFILTIATASLLPVVRQLGMGFVALAFATFMLIRYKSEVDQFYRAIDWDLIAFFAALFMVIHVMEHALVLELIGKGIQWIIGEGGALGQATLLLCSSVFSSVTDNIPLAAMLAKILSAAGTANDSGLWWSLIFGANLGGNLTPIGSASTLVAVTIIHKYELKLSFSGFVKAAVPFAVCHITLAVLYVFLVF